MQKVENEKILYGVKVPTDVSGLRETIILYIIIAPSEKKIVELACKTSDEIDHRQWTRQLRYPRDRYNNIICVRFSRMCTVSAMFGKIYIEVRVVFCANAEMSPPPKSDYTRDIV